MAAKPKILIVEDDEDTQSLYRDQLGATCQIFKATTLPEAVRLFEAFGASLALIVMDGVMECLSTESLVAHIAKTFKGPVLATSNHPFNRRRLMNAGCTHEVSKNDVEKAVRGLLKLPA